MKKLILFVFLSGFVALSQNNAQTKKWEPLEFLIGKWEGYGVGKFGNSDVIREYEYLMGRTYIIGKNKSIYEKQEQNPKGEIHDNWDIFSYDKIRAKYILRQFHAEDITNTYGLDSLNAFNGIYEFESEAIENFGIGWRAKEVYQIIDNDHFIELFYLAAPGKEYSEYVRNTFTRIK
ncbi:MAG: hypothetical protein IIB45_08295 [Candidatus Marinimicrobia bacterium]|nr:hypothetical protein [Candidatus Neomarinimicrobiota bacterium]